MKKYNKSICYAFPKVALSLALLFFSNRPLLAVETVKVVHDSPGQYIAGKLDAVSITEDGELSLAPWTQKLADLDDPIVWAMDVGPSGEIYLATGNDGRVFRVDPARPEPLVVADFPEVQVLALAVGKEGEVYAATSPDGLIYRMIDGQDPEPYVDLGAQYIWDLEVDEMGDLLVATGLPGAVFRVSRGPAMPHRAKEKAGKKEGLDPKKAGSEGQLAPGNTGERAPGAKGELDPSKTGSRGDLESGKTASRDGRESGPLDAESFKPDPSRFTKLLETEEAHILTLELDGRGFLYAGSAENGYVYRVNLSKPDKPEVLLDAPGDEVRQVLSLPDGSLAALTLGPVGEGVDDDLRLSGLLGYAVDDSGGEAPPRLSRVYRLVDGKAPKELVFADGITIHSLGFFGGRVLAGVGDEAKIVAIDPETTKVSFLADGSGKQVTAFTGRPEGSLYFACSNPASIFKIEDRWSKKGTFVSAPVRTPLFAYWGRIDLVLEDNNAGSVRVETRSGNTEKPNNTWSDWEKVKDRIRSPDARYLQYRLTLESSKGVAPKVRQISVFYRPVNDSPLVERIDILDPGVRTEKKDDFRLEPEPQGINQPRKDPLAPMIEGRTEALVQSARWEARDPDNDELEFQVDIREAEGSEWRTLDSNLEEHFVNFDSSRFPEGWYQLKVTARDSPSNPSEEVLEDALTSATFPIDHTPPEITKAKAKPKGLRARAAFTARDNTTYLRSGRYSVDGGPGVPLIPIDRVYDEFVEEFDFATADLTKGEHSIVLTVEDGVGNVATAELKFVIE